MVANGTFADPGAFFRRGVPDFLSEFVFITHYEIFKLVMIGTQIAGLALFTIAMAVVLKFTQFMMGDEDSQGMQL